MSIRIEIEKPLPLGQVSKLTWIPRRRGKSGRLHVSTVWRWAQKGIRGVKLEVIRVGGTLCTSTEALQRFFDRLANGNPVSESATTNAAQPNQDDVERQLDELGVRVTDSRRSHKPRPLPVRP